MRRFRLYDRGYDRPERKETLLQFDEAQVELQADFNAERVRLGNAHITTEKSRVVADTTLHYASERGLDVSAELGELDLSDLGHLLGIAIDGRLAGKARLHGPYSTPVIDATVTGQAFKFHLLQLGSVEATLHFRDELYTAQVGRADLGEPFVVKGDESGSTPHDQA